MELLYSAVREDETLTVHCREIADGAELILCGSFDAAAARDIRELLVQRVEATIVLDLAKATITDSFLAMLAQISGKFRHDSRQLRLGALSPQVEEFLTQMNLMQLFQVAGDDDGKTLA